MTNDILNVPHRHILFTIPEELRPFFCYDRTLLSNSLKLLISYRNINFIIPIKNYTESKIPKSSPNYFTNSDIVHYGLITVIHTLVEI